MLKDKEILVLIQEEWLCANDIVDYMTVVIYLRQRYGIKIFLESLVNIMKTIDKNIYFLLSLFGHLKIVEIEQLKKIQSLAKHMKDYNPHINIAVANQKDYTTISKYVKEIIPTSRVEWDEDENKEKEDTIDVYGDGWHYKRSFQTDIEKLLW